MRRRGIPTITDGRTVLGPPVRLELTPVNGYHSLEGQPEYSEKWVQLDLGKPLPLDEVRLYAARPQDFPVRSGFGFPLRFRVEASDAPDFARPVSLVEFRDTDCENPGDNPFVIPARGITASETTDSMRDIVWLIHPGPREAKDLLVRMREVAAQQLPDVECRFEAEGITGPFSLEFERQVFLLFKEALNNIRKHSHARHIAIRVTQNARDFVLSSRTTARASIPNRPRAATVSSA